MLRTLACSALLVALLLGSSSAGVPPEYSNRQPADAFMAGAVGGEGEDSASARVIPGAPYVHTGNSCDFADDIGPLCAPAGGSPDVFYLFQPAFDQCVDLSLCASTFYNTSLTVYEDRLSNILACNEDFCGAYSRISHLELHGGHSYYIAVDGSGYACGPYKMTISSCCSVPCPPGAVDEGEPECHLDYVDAYNGGCAIQGLGPLTLGPTGTTICGKYGTFASSTSSYPYRDTDWYRVDVAEPSILHLDVTGDVPSQIGILGGLTCELANVLCGRFSSGPCLTATCDLGVPAGTYWLFVAPMVFSGVPCGTRYVMAASRTAIAPTAMALLHTNDADGRPAALGQRHTVLGVVTGRWPAGSESRFCLQDATGGIVVWGTPQECGQLGDQMLVTGTVAQTDGLTVLSSPLELEIVHPGSAQPEPIVLTPGNVSFDTFRSDQSEPTESRLALLRRVYIQHADGGKLADGETFASDGRYRVKSSLDGTFTTIRILQTPNACNVTHPLVGLPIPTCAVDVTGVIGQSDPTAPFATGYEVYPRFPLDLVPPCQVPALRSTWARLKAHYR